MACRPSRSSQPRRARANGLSLRSIEPARASHGEWLVAKSLKATVDGVVANIKERSDGQDQIIDLIACEIGKDAKNKSDLMIEQARLGQRMEEQLAEAQEMMKSMQRNNQ